MTQRDQIINAFANGLARRIELDYYETDDVPTIVARLTAEQDREQGFTVDYTYPGQDDTRHIHVQDVYFTADELREVVTLAQQFAATTA